MQSWQLPEHIADILPERARHLESKKERLLALFRSYGYELVHPPLMEYSDSLLTHIDSGLSLKTIQVVDQISGRQLGIRADITPQVARIDAHLLSANQGINRLCYSGSVLHAKPEGFLNTREPFQTGAELYGYEGVEADIEIIELMLKSLAVGYAGDILLSLGHIGVFRTLAHAVELNAAQSEQLLALMQNKDADAVKQLAQEWKLDGMWAKAFALLPSLYGGREIIQEARNRLPDLSAISEALNQLEAVCQAFPEQLVHIDLSELRVDNYHTGLLYAAYGNGNHDALARGGRYDGLGKYFGRNRPATGFSFDLRQFAVNATEPRRSTIAVSYQDLEAARETVEQLREQGESVIIDYGIESNNTSSLSRRLVERNGVWEIQ
ncbi:MAG: ATP phosphoribosyltransferase regulatory subunit [Neisseria sp.]|uniref:ATP phosphoribosyltransferase regulatory subunit n=1 Tax=Neisseria sp. TaxID=192066 RepID=UPI0026DD5241|nr:ATP phosphoribosyltransferase regulatory subunit [Neisseria sp.]MDO4640982.1 ATP phosphoribosyltransferase regulatory subunit [Neisseria sp.]